MCGRYAFYANEDLTERYDLSDEVGVLLEKNYNISPGQYSPIVTNTRGENKLTLMKWGLVPSWAKSQDIGYKMINARAETIMDKPSYKVAFKKRRCLIPFNGFYEWKKSDGQKQPFYFTSNANETLSFAGLWENWEIPGQAELKSFTIITTLPNETVKPIHQRMPAVLNREAEKLWLNEETDEEKLTEVLFDTKWQPPLLTYPVDVKVNKTTENSPELIQPLS